MAKLPIYTQRYQAGTRQADAGDFGAAEGRGMQQLGASVAEVGETLAAIEDRRKNRADVIEGVRASNAFEQAAVEEHVRKTAEEDISSVSAPKEYNQFLKQTMSQTLENFGGSAAAKEKLAAQMEALLGEYSRNMYKESTAAQFKVLDNSLVTAIKTQSDLAGDMPESYEERLASIDGSIAEMTPALTPEMERAYREQAHNQITKATINTYLAAGDYDAAAEVLGKKGVSETLDPDTNRQIKTQIIAGRRQDEKEEAALEHDLRMLEAEYGLKADLWRMQAKVKTSGVKWSEMSPMQRIDAVNADRVSRGMDPLSDDQKDKMYNTYIKADEETLYGKSLRGRALSRVTEMAPAFANGMMSDEQERLWEADITELTRPIVDKETGRVIQQTIPPFVTEAFNRRGLPIPGADAAEQPDVFQNEGLPDYGQVSLFDMAGEIAGPVPRLQRFLGAVPFVGGPLGEAVEAPAAEQAKLQYDNLGKMLVHFLQTSPRFAEAERQQIESETSIDPGVWSNTDAVQNRLIGIDKSLAERYRLHAGVLNDPNTSAEELRHATTMIQGLAWFRKLLDAPVPVKSQQEMNKVLEKNPSAKIQLPSGRIITRKRTQ